MRYAIALLILFLSGCGGGNKAGLSFAKDSSMSALGQKGDAALAEFKKACPNLDYYASDIENPKATTNTFMQSRPKEFNWRNIVEVSFKVKNHPSHHQLIENNSFGYTCYFLLGGGASPGFISWKPMCASVCGDATELERGYFQSAPGLAVID